MGAIRSRLKTVDIKLRWEVVSPNAEVVRRCHSRFHQLSETLLTSTAATVPQSQQSAIGNTDQKPESVSFTPDSHLIDKSGHPPIYYPPVSYQASLLMVSHASLPGILDGAEAPRNYHREFAMLWYEELARAL